MKRNELQLELFCGDEALCRLDERLWAEMPVEPPAGLAERVVEATAGELDVAACAGEADRSLAALEADLGEALAPRPPVGLAERVYEATAGVVALRSGGGGGGAAPSEAGGVIGWIGRSPAWRGAIAAAIVAAVSLGIWLSIPQPAPQPPMAEGPLGNGSTVEVAVLLEQLERSLAPAGGAIEAELLTLSVELDELDMAFDERLLAGGFREPELLDYELMLLEAGFDF